MGQNKDTLSFSPLPLPHPQLSNIPLERAEDITSDNFNTVFDYAFTPESHFYFVFVRDRAAARAAFTKIAYLFGG